MINIYLIKDYILDLKTYFDWGKTSFLTDGDKGIWREILGDWCAAFRTTLTRGWTWATDNKLDVESSLGVFIVSFVNKCCGSLPT